MASWESEPYVQRLVNDRALSHDVRSDLQWTYVRPRDVQLPDHGWKLHVSSKAATLPELAGALVPFLLDEGCSFKLALSVEVLSTMNQGYDSPAAVGKAFTIYSDQSQIRELGHALVELLRGHEGPRILSDRQISADAPVYYRYGPFVRRWFRGQRGVMTIQIPGPNGERFDGLAEMEYRQPDWVTDPFLPAGSAAPGRTLGGRYRVERGVHRTAQGNVFRAHDVETDRHVIVKQARAFVGDPGDGTDARTRLRNERRLLAACEGILGVPRFIDHFAHGAEEYLVTTDVGARNLFSRVTEDGAMLAAGEPMPAEFVGLVREIATTLIRLHERGVVMRDLTPRNIVLGPDRAYVVDFGISSLDGLSPRGGTNGFARWEQLNGGKPDPRDDLYTFGMTLAFSATGLPPVIDETAAGVAAERMIATVAALYGDRHPEFTALVADLITGTPEAATTALHRAAGGLAGEAAARSAVQAGIDALGRAVRFRTPPVEALEERVLDTLLGQIDRFQLEQPDSSFPSIDPTVYTGSAGIGLELLWHRNRSGVDDVLKRLAAHAIRANRRTAPPPGLYFGSTGTHLFLGSMVAAGFDAPLPEIPAVPYDADDDHDDIMTGTAGAGMAYLLLAQILGDAGHPSASGCLDAARICAEKLLTRRDLNMSVDSDTGLPPEIATEPTYSYAHGKAGVIDFLLGYVAHTGDETVADDVRERLPDLLGKTAELIPRSTTRRAVPVSAAWCQGLAGMGRTLLRAARILGEERYATRALELADVCAGWVPRLYNLSQCCGLAGVGNYLVDVARHTGEERHRDAVDDVVRQLMRRSFGPDDAPLFIDPDRQDAPLCWSMGNAGILTLLRRVARPETPDAVPGYRIRVAVG